MGHGSTWCFRVSFSVPINTLKQTTTYPNMESWLLHFCSKQLVRWWDAQASMRKDNPALPHNERTVYRLLQCWWILHGTRNLIWILSLTVEYLCLRGTSCNHVHLFRLGTHQLDKLCKNGSRARWRTGQMDKAHKPPKLPKLAQIQAHILCKWMWPLPTLRMGQICRSAGCKKMQKCLLDTHNHVPLRYKEVLVSWCFRPALRIL